MNASGRTTLFRWYSESTPTGEDGPWFGTDRSTRTLPHGARHSKNTKVSPEGLTIAKRPPRVRLAPLAELTADASIDTAQLLFTLGWIEIRERQSDKKHSTDNIACRAEEQVMQCIGESERPASEHCH